MGSPGLGVARTPGRAKLSSAWAVANSGREMPRRARLPAEDIVDILAAGLGSMVATSSRRHTNGIVCGEDVSMAEVSELNGVGCQRSPGHGNLGTPQVLRGGSLRFLGGQNFQASDKGPTSVGA